LGTQISTILGATGIGTTLSNREGCLKIDDNSFAIPKIIYLKKQPNPKGGFFYRIPVNFKDYIGAPALYRNWYFPDSPAIQNNFLGQYRLIKSLSLRWSISKYVQTQTNPYFIINGKFAKFTFINWTEASHKAEADIEFREPFDKNITEYEL
jgi:hypothetical protein